MLTIEYLVYYDFGSAMNKNTQMIVPQVVTLAVDLMGGDASADVRLSAVMTMLKSYKNLRLRVFVSRSYLDEIADKVAHLSTDLITFIECESTVAMDESPFSALRKKRASSLSMAIKDVADDHADICVTAGNTGAMVALAKYWMNLLDEIEKPVLATLLPGAKNGQKHRTLLLDVGATIDARADDLYNFARLGSAFQQALFSIKAPEVALLNVGLESNKGDDTVRQADKLLEESQLNYVGYCEGSHLFNGFADVICCNGFVGNVTLKSCEAMADFVKNNNNKKHKLTIWQKIKKGMRIVEPDKYNGALLLGLDGMIMKSHGNCNALSFGAALSQAYSAAQYPMINKMTELLENA